MDWVPKSPLEENIIHKDIFNTFTGFDAQLVEEPNDFLIDPILKHLKVVWADSVEINYTYILDWLATCVQFPRKKIPAFVVTGKQGCGKTIIVEWLMKDMFGHRCSIVQNNLNEVLDKYNSILSNKFLVYVAETGGTTNKDGNIWGKMEQFKTLISDNRIRLEAKYVNAYMASNYLHWILSTNHLDSIRIEPNDRKFQILEASNAYIGNVQYFIDLAASLTNEAADHFYTFLSQREITMDLKVFDTTAKVELRNLGLPNPVRFWNALSTYEWAPTNMKPKPETLFKDARYLLSKQEFFVMYKFWCLETGEKATNHDWVFRHLAKHDVKYEEVRPNNAERYITLSDELAKHIKSPIENLLAF